MQKFGLQRSAASRHNAIEREVVKEQATALGRAGKKLRLSLERHNTLVATKVTVEQEQASLKEISNNIWELMLQREFLGFVDHNLKWITDNYVIPEAAIQTIGKFA